MKNDVFGSQSVGRGAHIPSQAAWNDLNRSITNVSVGNDGGFFGDVTEYGTQIPYDAPLLPHTASVNFGSTDALIGADRGEDHYPFVDALGVTTFTRVDTFKFTSGIYSYLGQTSRDSSSTSVIFETSSTITPDKPADNSDSGIVGYGWDLEALVTDVSFDVSSSDMVVTTKWTPGVSFDDDSQAALYTVDSSSAGAWGTTSGRSTNFSSYEDLINDWLVDASASTITLAANADSSVFDREISVPVAAYEWNDGQLKITRCVQMLFASEISSGVDSSGSGASSIKDSLSGHIEAPSEKTYTLELSAPTSGIITNVVTDCGAGTGDALLKIAGVSVDFVTVGTTIDFSTTETAFEPTDETTASFVAGGIITLVLENLSGLADAVFTVEFTRGIQ